MDSHKKTILKTISWRIVATCITFTVGYTIFGSVIGATALAGVDTGIKIVAYYLHERTWNNYES
tara:strand:- start:187 stop:378 length:192 start_codon:yes stop_codon:yes gene_type:complete